MAVLHASNDRREGSIYFPFTVLLLIYFLFEKKIISDSLVGEAITY